MSVALVTGGSRGIGRAIVEEFAAKGYKVAFTYAGNQAAAESLAGVARPYQADSRDFNCAEKVVADVQSVLGPIDVLVNNAGIKRDGALHNMDPVAWQEVIDTNLTGTFNYSRAVMKHLIRRGGSVINITSVSGIIGMAGQTNYSASKAGVIALTKSLAKETARSGVIVNCITPAVIETDLLKQMSQEHIDYMLSKIPMGRFGLKEEAAALVAWLCSADCSFSTGAVFDLSGGRATY